MIFIYIIISVVIAAILSFGWFRLSNQVNLNSESFRDATKLGITITTLICPLLITSSEKFQKDDLFEILTIFALSTIIGLWNSFSIATLTTEEGKIEISLKKNTLIPPLLVLQFISMILGIILMISYLNIDSSKQNKNAKPILSNQDLLGKSKQDLIKCLGKPDSTTNCKNIVRLTYYDKNSVTTFQLTNDTIFQLDEHKNRNDTTDNH